MKLVLGLALLFAGAAGVWLVLSGKFPPSSTTSTTSSTTGAGEVNSSGSSASAGTEETNGSATVKSASGSGGQSMQSLIASRSFLQPANHAGDLYLR